MWVLKGFKKLQGSYMGCYFGHTKIPQGAERDILCRVVRFGGVVFLGKRIRSGEIDEGNELFLFFLFSFFFNFSSQYQEGFFRKFKILK